MPEKLTVDQFYESGRAGKLIGLKCDSAHFTVPPRHCCSVCNSTNVETVELSGKGRIVSFTEVNVKTKEFPLPTPYVLSLVTLDEGGNLLGIFSGSANLLEHGTKVSVIFRDIGDNAKWPRVFFEPI
ncbi:MAG: Zn-ribbon domain-containing OB-fold protein [Nitrososphaerota archaeon]|nr:Zn-ribbon domain-containing OB-fold protein [Nitrososphaerota archaeon]